MLSTGDVLGTACTCPQSSNIPAQSCRSCGFLGMEVVPSQSLGGGSLRTAHLGIQIRHMAEDNSCLQLSTMVPVNREQLGWWGGCRKRERERHRGRSILLARKGVRSLKSLGYWAAELRPGPQAPPEMSGSPLRSLLQKVHVLCWVRRPAW